MFTFDNTYADNQPPNNSCNIRSELFSCDTSERNHTYANSKCIFLARDHGLVLYFPKDNEQKRLEDTEGNGLSRKLESPFCYICSSAARSNCWPQSDLSKSKAETEMSSVLAPWFGNYLKSKSRSLYFLFDIIKYCTPDSYVEVALRQS